MRLIIKRGSRYIFFLNNEVFYREQTEQTYYLSGSFILESVKVEKRFGGLE